MLGSQYFSWESLLGSTVHFHVISDFSVSIQNAFSVWILTKECLDIFFFEIIEVVFFTKTLKLTGIDLICLFMNLTLPYQDVCHTNNEMLLKITKEQIIKKKGISAFFV